MKRVVVFAVLLALLLPCVARAWDNEIFYGNMIVVNCNEWISLRDVPGSGGKRLAKVPLGAIVSDAEWIPLYDKYVYCRFGGQYGYALMKYLQPEGEGAFTVEMDRVVNDLEIVALRSYRETKGILKEMMLAYAVDGNGAVRWSRRVAPVEPTELTCTAAFWAGTAQEPRVMLYSVEEGLTALSAKTGEVLWKLTPDEVRLGASLSWAVAEDGTMYIGGYYGPDPVAVSQDGEVLWQADCGSDDIFWLYEIELRGEEIAAHYDAFPDSEAGGWVIYGADGEALRFEKDK